MKKSGLLLLTLLLAVLCVGCGGGDNTVSQEQPVENPEAELLLEKYREVGSEAIANMTQEEVIAVLGEPRSVTDTLKSDLLMYDMALDGDLFTFWVEYYDPERAADFSSVLDCNAQGPYPISVSATYLSEVSCPAYELAGEFNAGNLTLEEFFDRLSDWGAVCVRGNVLDGDPIPKAEFEMRYENSIYVYTSDYRYSFTVYDWDDGTSSMHPDTIVSLKQNPLWDSEALCFRSGDSVLKSWISQGFDPMMLLGKTPDEVFAQFPFPRILQYSITDSEIDYFCSTSLSFSLSLQDGKITSVHITDRQDAQERGFSFLTLHGLPLSASLQDMEQHMCSLGYEYSSGSRSCSFTQGYTVISIGLMEDRFDFVTLKDVSGAEGYNPLEEKALRNSVLLEDYFLKNLAIYGYGSILADLTHDGLDELLVTTPDDWGGNTLSVYTVQDDQVVELYSRSFNMQANANVGELYLYSEDGKDYLMEVSVQISYMSANSYTLYSLDESGQPVLLRGESTADGTADDVVQEHKSACLETATLLISHQDRYAGNAYGMDLKPVDLMEVICYPERAAKKTLGDFYNTDVSVKINSPDPFAQSGNGLPDNMLNDVFWIRTSSPLVSIGDAMVGMTEADFLAALEPLRNPAFRQTLPTLSHPFLEGTYYAPVVDYTLKDGVVTEVTMYVSLADPA